MKRSRTTDTRRKQQKLGCERLEIRRVLDASALALWDAVPVEGSSQSLTLDESFSATANAQFGDFTYTSSNGRVTITGYTGAGGAVEIPETIGGMPVRVIGAAFNDNVSITSITMPTSLISIDDFAFSDCTDLTSVTIPDGVWSISDSAFYNCTSLPAITVASSNNTYASVDGVLYNKTLTTLIKCPAGKTDSVAIPASVTSIASNAFRNCTGLPAITVASSNAAYASVDGVLYNKALTTLIHCPAGKT